MANKVYHSLMPFSACCIHSELRCKLYVHFLCSFLADLCLKLLCIRRGDASKYHCYFCRFFAVSEKPLHKTSFFGQLQKGYGADQQEATPREQSTETACEGTGESETEAETAPKCANNSPYQSFGFSKVKQRRDSLQNDITNSTAVSSQFKPVRSERNHCDTPQHKKDSEPENNSQEYSDDTDTFAGSSVSLPSSLYSIDSDCKSLSSSQVSEVTTSWDSPSSSGHSPPVHALNCSPTIVTKPAASRLALFANKKHSASFTYPQTSQPDSATVCDLTADEELTSSRSPPTPQSQLRKSASGSYFLPLFRNC